MEEPQPLVEPITAPSQPAEAQEAAPEPEPAPELQPLQPTLVTPVQAAEQVDAAAPQALAQQPGETVAAAPEAVAGPEVYTDYETALTAAQGRGKPGALAQELPVPDGGGGFVMAERGTPEYKEARQLLTQFKAGIQPEDVMNSRGEPFTHRYAADRAARNAGEGYAAVKVRDGYVVRQEG